MSWLHTCWLVVIHIWFHFILSMYLNLVGRNMWQFIMYLTMDSIDVCVLVVPSLYTVESFTDHESFKASDLYSHCSHVALSDPVPLPPSSGLPLPPFCKGRLQFLVSVCEFLCDMLSFVVLVWMSGRGYGRTVLCQRSFSSLQRPHRLWGPYSLVLNYCLRSPGIQRPGHEADPSSMSSAITRTLSLSYVFFTCRLITHVWCIMKLHHVLLLSSSVIS